MTRKQWLIALIVALASALTLLTVFIVKSYQPVGTLPTTPPIVITPTPSVTTTVNTPSPSVSTPAPSISVTPSATKSTSAAPTPSVSPSATATATYPAANDCTPGSPGAYQRLGQCAVDGKTPQQVFDDCRVAGNGFMWNMSRSLGEKVSDKARLAAVKACVAGFGLKYVDFLTDVQGSPLKGGSTLGYIMVKGGIKDGSIKRFLFDAKTGIILDDTNKMKVFDDWVDGFHIGG